MSERYICEVYMLRTHFPAHLSRKRAEKELGLEIFPPLFCATVWQRVIWPTPNIELSNTLQVLPFTFFPLRCNFSISSTLRHLTFLEPSPTLLPPEDGYTLWHFVSPFGTHCPEGWMEVVWFRILKRVMPYLLCFSVQALISWPSFSLLGCCEIISFL